MPHLPRPTRGGKPQKGWVRTVWPGKMCLFPAPPLSLYLIDSMGWVHFSLPRSLCSHGFSNEPAEHGLKLWGKINFCSSKLWESALFSQCWENTTDTYQMTKPQIFYNFWLLTQIKSKSIIKLCCKEYCMHFL